MATCYNGIIFVSTLSENETRKENTMKNNNNQINVGYLRISHTESLNGTSLEVQEEKCKAFGLLHGFKIDKFYSEIVSGSVEFRKRPVFQKALSHLSNGSKLVVSRLDRLSRSVLDTLQIVKTFEKSGVDLCISDIGNVHKDAVSKVFITIMASLGEVERENISYRIKSAKAEHKKQNKHLGGYLPFGFSKKSDGTLDVNSKEAEIYQSIINLKKNKVPLRKISEVIKNKYARKLHYSYISKL